jgi:hypothetical protein
VHPEWRLPFVAQFAICCQSVPVQWTDWQSHTSPRRRTISILKRASASRLPGEWSDNDYDVLAEASWLAKFSKPMPRLSECHGCGRWFSVTMRIARPCTAMPRHGKS